MADNSIISLLPEYLQTETLKKVFSATVDHLFQKANIEFLNGYIGDKPAWYNRSKDVYITEPDKFRTDYQLVPTTVSVDFLNGQITNSMFYDDLIGHLRFQGANVQNHDRLFSGEYYSWSPPIDLDKFVNFSSYLWLPSGPDSIVLLETTDLANELGNANYTYEGSYQLSSTGEVFSGILKFANGLKIKPTQDVTLSYNDNEYYVEGIGRYFKLVYNAEIYNPAWDIFAWNVDSWDGDDTQKTKQYVTIKRGSPDGNTWSEQNRWFHQSVVSISKTYIADQYTAQALRPIIEFDSGMELYNYGTFGRGIVDVCDNGTGDVFGSIVGQTSYQIQNIELQDGMRILVTADVHPTINNRIYLVSGVANGAIQLTLDTGGQNNLGIPTKGDRAYIRFGSSEFESKNVYFDGDNWTVNGQQKTGTNAPLFQLYDSRGNSFNDPSVYIQSSFKGSKVFSYQQSNINEADAELGIPVNYDQFGDYIFDNNLNIDVVEYLLDNKVTNYVGDLYVYINQEYAVEYINGWWKSQYPSRQYIVNYYQLPDTVSQFEIDQSPAAREANGLPTIFVVKISAAGQETMLYENVDYTVNDNVVTLQTPALSGERVIIKSWNSSTPSTLTGYYEIPKNISSNPNNLPVTSVSRSQIIQHFIEIIQNQYNFSGHAIGLNNFKDVAQNRSLGLSILQHRAPMLKLALLNSTSFSDINNSTNTLDPMLVMDYAQRSYITFYNRFVQTLFNLYKSVTITGANTPDEWVAKALSTINVGKNTTSPWANSGPTSLPGQYCSMQQTNPTYVPASPTRLGIMPSYQPYVYFDDAYSNPQLVLQTHDGARIVLIDDSGYQLGTILHDQLSTTNPSQLSNPVAAAWLQFELNLYNSLPATYKNEDYTPVFDVRAELPGRWRTTDYSQTEFLNITRGFFDKWCITNQVNFSANTGYDTNNPLSYNYRSVNDNVGNPVPGHWQGIYRWYYDTDRPHTHPWEMLGFSVMPSWWMDEYGPAPYTSGNTALWEDLRDGYVRQGMRAGINSSWSRPDLMNCIPVDNQGNLLPPFLAGCTGGIPSVLDAQALWIYGDGSPIETVWVNSSDGKFSIAKAAYLMKPARFVEYNWDTLRTENIFADQENSQWIYIDTNSRRSSQQFYVHRENPSILNIGTTIPNESNLTYFGSCGFQHWISEYLIGKGYNVTNYFGNIIRGGDLKLAHRMAGFTQTDSFRALVDSFGQIGYNSRLIPSENINIYMYKSGSIGESVYSGVIIEQVKDGWRIRGYDAVNPYFTIIPNNPTSAKSTVVVGNQRVIQYDSGLPKTDILLYGTLLPTRQDVYNFLIAYGRWLESQGWIFNEYDGLSNTVNNWTKSAKEFLFWSQGQWDNGTFITVSPSAETVTFSQPYGNIQYVNGTISGTYPVLDRAGQPIQQKDLNVVRQKSSIKISSLNDQGVFLVKLYRNELEHAVFFDNTTAFNDIIYQPLFTLYQQRILIYAYRAKDWDGRVDIPGYFLVQNTVSNTWTLTSNFDKSADDFTKFFNVEQPTTYQQISPGPTQGQLLTTELGGVDTTSLSKLAKHSIGYQSRDYLQNLLLDDATEFEFYQGFIRQKGTESTLNKLLRNNNILPAGSSLRYNEEWLFRTSWYGGYDLNQVMEYILPQNRINNSPNQVRFFTQQTADSPYDNIFDLVPGDPLIVTPPINYINPLFSLKTTYAVDPKTDLPTAGYPLLGETTFYIKTPDELLSLYTNQQLTTQPLAAGNTIWQFISDNLDWTVLRVNQAESGISYTVPSSVTGEPTVFVTNLPHGLIDGDICVISNILGLPEIDGTYKIFNVTPTSFSIDISTFSAGAGGNILVYRAIRFKDTFDRDSNTPPMGWNTGDLCYVDEGGIVAGAWTVYKYIQNTWVPYRQQQYKVDASLLISSELFDSVSKNKIADVYYYDPAQGRIAGNADAEITYKTDYDPAKYNSGDLTGYAVNVTEAWDSAQLGEVWWDLTTVRYIDYEQGDDAYRVANWGKLAPGTSIDVYEWVRSSIPPADWASYAANGSTITVNGQDVVPSGTIRNPDSPNWSEYVEINDGGTSTTYYYFWVKNSSLSSLVNNRQLTTQNIASLIANPNYRNQPWYAAISQNSIIIGNVSRYLNADTTIQRITFTNKLNDSNNYNEWQLIKENDPDGQPNASLWEKMKDSLVTFDGLNNDVPYYRLTSLQKYGNFVRPRQTWFTNRISASQLFVDTANTLISNLTTPLVTDSSKIAWTNYFNAEEPQPTNTEWDYHVSDLGQRDALIGAITPGQIVLVDAVSATNNLWTLWQYNSSGSLWTLLRIQYYKVSNFWSYVDWYAAGYTNEILPLYTIDTLGDLESLDNISTNTIVKVRNDGTNKWQLYVYDGDNFVLVGQQDGSIEISPNIYQWSDAFGGFDGLPFDTSPIDLTAAVEFAYVIDGIKNAIFGSPDSIEINNIFFTMIKYVLSEQGQVDWIIKTSNISLKGIAQPLDTYKLLPVDLTDSLIGFINEAKPYHVKISDLVTAKTYTDNASVSVVDFDWPPTFNPTAPPDDGSLAWQIYNSTYQSYLNNYKTNPSLIRKLKTTLIFDRIATPSQRPGWGTSWNLPGWSNESGSSYFGAIDRIEQFYNPIEGMIPKIISELMIGVEFRSTLLDSLGLTFNAGWSVGPWDSNIGWEPNNQTISNYLDLIVQGGQIPRYDIAVGNGITSEFNLLYDPTNPLDMVVWSNGSIKVYDTDWVVPTNAASISVIEGGINYTVGDQLDVIAGTGLAPVRVQVTATNHGAITELEILGKGSYRTVTRGPYQLQYPIIYPGIGSDALVDIDWSCERITFTTPPPSSSEPNIYILYAGTTFEPAPTDESDTIYSGSNFVIPHADANHPEEYVPMKVRDSLILDTYVRPTGGRPYVTSRVYQTNGISEQFDIGLKPENNISVFVYLDNVLQREGLAFDYVINFATNKIVFLSAPAAGILRITSISTGGASRSILDAYVVDRGSGYLPGDTITLSGGVGTPGQLTLTSVTNTSAIVQSPGQGYNVGDKLTINGGTLYTSNTLPGAFTISSIVVVDVSPRQGGINYLVGDNFYITGSGFTQQIHLVVSSVAVGGSITGFTISNGGEYTDINAPTTNVIASSTDSLNGYGATVDLIWGVKTVNAATNTEYSVIPANPVATIGSGTGATLMIEWAAGHAVVAVQGLYNRLPDQPCGQLPLSLTNGTGATWNVSYTKRLKEYIYEGDGTAIDFSVPGTTLTYPGGILVFVDGEFSTYSRLTNAVRLPLAPAYGASVVINTFDNDQFSLIEETSIDITNPVILTYPLSNQYPAHTMPYFTTTLVRQNGNLMQPPIIQTWIGNGSTRDFSITVDIVTGVIIATDIYVDSQLQTLGVDYNIVNQTILFTYSPALNSEIVLVCTKNTTKYTLSLIAGITYINFITGSISISDNILVTTYAEDVDYNFITEEFWLGGLASTNLTCPLATTPYDLLTISVWADGILLTPVYDYVVEIDQQQSGWDANPWDITLWDSTTEPRTVVRLAESAKPIDEDAIITITYMRGLPERLPVAWRTLIYESGTLSTAIDNTRKTAILSNVYVTSTSIEIADITKITPPTVYSPQYLYINNELIGYYEIQQAPTISNPNRGFINNLIRNANGTSGVPEDRYVAIFYNGDGTNIYFATEPVGEAIAETVWVNENLQIPNVDYEIVLDPTPLIGRYVKFNFAPTVGYKNVKIVSLNANSYDTSVSHVALSPVIDAGDYVKLPNGYNWEPTPYGIQFNKTSQSEFLLSHSGTRS